MSAVEAAPVRPPRPSQRPSIPKAKKAKENQLGGGRGGGGGGGGGYSKDLESINFGEPFEQEDEPIRRRSMTLDSQSSHRHSYKRATTQPHIIDSSKGSPRLMTKSPEHKKVEETQDKPKLPASVSKPNRPPPPSFSRSASQPQVVKNNVGGASSGEEVAVVRRRPPSADSAVSRTRSPPPIVTTARRMSSPLASRDSSPLPDVPEDESGVFVFSPSHVSRSATSASPQATPTPPNATPTKPLGALPPRPPPSQLPPRPVRPKSRSSKPTTPTSAHSPPPIFPPPSLSEAHPSKLSMPPSQETTPPTSPPVPESPASIPSDEPDTPSPTSRGISPPPRPTRQRSSTSPCIMMTDKERREIEKLEDGSSSGMNHLSTSKGGGNDGAHLHAPSGETTDGTPAVPPRPFLPPRPFPPNSRPEHRPNRPNERRRVTAPAITPIKKQHHHRGDRNREANGNTDKTSPSRPKRGTRHHPRHHPKPSHNQSPAHKDSDSPSRNPKNDNDRSEEASSESQPPSVHVSSENATEDPGSAGAAPSNATADSQQQQQQQQPGDDGQESVFKKKQLKFVSFRSRESIVNDMSYSKQDNVEETAPVSSSPTKGRKIMNSMKKSFRSLRIKKQKSPSASPETRKRSNSEDTGEHDGMGVVDERYPDPLPQGIIDPIVIQCVAYLNKESVLLEEGLFRVPGDLAAIRRLRQDFMHGHYVNLAEILDPHTVAGLLKLHFREQKSSLIPRGPPLTTLMEHVRNRDVEGVSDELAQLDVITMSTLSIVVEVLGKVAAHSSTNMMTAGTLATSCGPSLFPYLPPSSANQITKFLIDNWNDIFHPNTAPVKKDKLVKECQVEEEDEEEIKMEDLEEETDKYDY